MMLLSLDNLAHRYGMLPSEALARGTSFDLHVLDLGAKWVKHQHELDELKRSGIVNPPKREKLTQEDMLAMIKNVRGEQ